MKYHTCIIKPDKFENSFFPGNKKKTYALRILNVWVYNHEILKRIMKFDGKLLLEPKSFEALLYFFLKNSYLKIKTLNFKFEKVLHFFFYIRFNFH